MKLFKASLVVIILSFLIRLLGLVRDAILAMKFGISADIDMYFLALTIITIVPILLSLAIQNFIVPIYYRVKENQGTNYLYQSINYVLLWVFIISLITCLIYLIIISVLNSINFDYELNKKLFLLVKLGLPITFFSLIESFFIGYLLARKFYYITALSSLPINLIMILYLLIFNDVNVITLMLVTSFAYFAKFVMTYLISQKYGYKLFCRIKKTEEIESVIRMIVPTVIGSSVFLLNTYIDRFYTFTMSPGSASSIVYSGKIITLAHSIIILSILNVVFPKISEKFTLKEDQYSIYKTGNKFLILVGFFFTLICVVFPYEITNIIYGRGSFGGEAITLTGDAFRFYALGFIAFSLIENQNRYSFSTQNAKVVIILCSLVTILNILFSSLFSNYYGVKGIAFATTISFFIGVILFYFVQKLTNKKDSLNLLKT